MAIIPAAGRGTRMADITRGTPKELLSLGRQTVLERVIDEAVRAGADHTVIVSSEEKPEIASAVAEWSRGRFREAQLQVVNQTSPLGLGDAVLGWDIPDLGSDVIVLLGDCAYEGGSPLERMSRLIYRGIDGGIAVEEVADDEVTRYGICEVDDMGTIRRILEKPRPEDTRSRWAIAARYAFGAPAMACMRESFRESAQRRPNREISMTPAMQAAIVAGFEFKAIALAPSQRRVDCGTPEEYAAARRLAWD